MYKAARGGRRQKADEASEEETESKNDEKLDTSAQTDEKRMDEEKQEDEESEQRYLESLRPGSCVGILGKLTHKQRILLRETFQAMEDESTRNGVSIFVRLFQDQPNYKKLFPKFNNVPDSSLISSNDLRTHASIYMSGLKQIIDSIDEEHALYTQLKKIATSHERKGVRKFHILNMLPMVLGTLKCCLDILTPEVEEAWTALFDVISCLVEELRPGQSRAWGGLAQKVNTLQASGGF